MVVKGRGGRLLAVGRSVDWAMVDAVLRESMKCLVGLVFSAFGVSGFIEHGCLGFL